MLPRMATTLLTDRDALLRNRKRALWNPAFFLQEAAIDEVKDRLSFVNKAFTKLTIITGFSDLWQRAFPDACVIADNDTLDLEEATSELIIHAMCLHWSNDPVGQMVQARRALVPDGLFLAVFFGGQTLHQLRSALAQAESDLRGGLSPRVVPMGDIRDLGALLQRAGFALPVADLVPLDASYADPLALMKDLRAMGETNALAGRIRHFSRRDVLQRAFEIYIDNFGTPDGRVAAAFDLVTLTGWAPGPDQPQPLRPGSATSRLADVLGTSETPLKD